MVPPARTGDKHHTTTQINVSRSVARRALKHYIGELCLTPTLYSITYSESVPSVEKPIPEGGRAVAELAADIGRVEGEPKNILAVDINANNVTAGDDTRMVQFDLSGAVDYIIDAKTRGVDNSRRRDDLQYIRKIGRRTSYQKEEARREEQKVTRGSTKLHQKLKHRCRSLKKSW